MDGDFNDEGDNYDFLQDGFNPLEVRQLTHKPNLGSSENRAQKRQVSSLQSKSSNVVDSFTDASACTPRKNSNKSILVDDDEEAEEDSFFDDN